MPREPTRVILSVYFSRHNRDAVRDVLHMIAAFQSLPCRDVIIHANPVYVQGSRPPVGCTLQCDAVPNVGEGTLLYHRSHWTQQACSVATLPSRLTGDRRLVFDAWLRVAGFRDKDASVLPVLDRFINAGVDIQQRFHRVLLDVLRVFTVDPLIPITHRLHVHDSEANAAVQEAFNAYVNGPMAALRRQHAEMFRAAADESCPVCLEKFTVGVGQEATPELAGVEPFITPCAHLFHFDCYRSHCMATPPEMEVRCPMCRAPVPSPV